MRTINLISCFRYCRLCSVSAIIHAVTRVTTSFYDELTDLLDRRVYLFCVIIITNLHDATAVIAQTKPVHENDFSFLCYYHYLLITYSLTYTSHSHTPDTMSDFSLTGVLIVNVVTQT